MNCQHTLLGCLLIISFCQSLAFAAAPEDVKGMPLFNHISEKPAIIRYQQLLKDNPNDIEALSGLGWEKLYDNQWAEATAYFERVLKIQPQNQDALMGIQQINQAKHQQIINKKKQQDNPQISCNADQGLVLLNQADPPLLQIKQLLSVCDAITPDATNTLLLHGLLARHEALADKHFDAAIQWLIKAVNAAAPDDLTPAVELAVTFEWAGEVQQAALIYQAILAKERQNRIALLGQARVFRVQSNYQDASITYEQLLQNNASDIDALNGLGWVKLSENKLLEAGRYFERSLILKPLNQDALVGLQHIKNVKLQEKPPILCDADHGLILLNQTKPPVAEIQNILSVCDKNTPHATNSLLLHGLLARHQALKNKKFETAIAWLEKAKATAAPDNLSPLFELAVTYEWAHDNEKAASLYQSILALHPQNQAALLGQARVLKAMKQPVKPPSLCDADKGLLLLNKTPPSLVEIKHILNVCDKNTPQATPSLLLHGLLARYEAKDNKHYETALSWLKKAMASAAPNDFTPALELAITEEWAGETKKALAIYQAILSKHPHHRDALLGKARVYRMEFRLNDSMAIYQQLVKENPKDVDALNGLGWSQMANFQLNASKHSFEDALRAKPYNSESMTAMKKLKTVTKYILALTGGRYTVPPEAATGTDVYFYNSLNATDSLTVFATHNSKQIGSEFFTTPTLLPSNSVLVGYQYNLPVKYGWGVGYDYRQHTNHPVEHRILGSANYFITPQFQWFGGGRVGTPSPWINQLYYSGLTLFTELPVNFTVTGFWANDEFGGPNSAYSIDLSKQYDDHRFYDIGTAYSPTLKNWEFHGRLIWPTFENQAFVADFSHYYFNNSTFINAGWRIYW